MLPLILFKHSPSLQTHLSYCSCHFLMQFLKFFLMSAFSCAVMAALISWISSTFTFHLTLQKNQKSHSARADEWDKWGHTIMFSWAASLLEGSEQQHSKCFLLCWLWTSLATLNSTCPNSTYLILCTFRFWSLLGFQGMSYPSIGPQTTSLMC